MPDSFSTSVEQIEAEAEKIIQQARVKAAEIIVKAKEEANQVLNRELPLDNVKAECTKIINEADKEAGIRIHNTGKDVANIKSSAVKNLDKIAKNMAAMVMGTE